MSGRVDQSRFGQWAARLLLAAAVAQGCGGSGSQTTAATSSSGVTVVVRGLERAQIPSDCSGVLTVTGADMSPLSVAIPSDGRASVAVTPGIRTFAVTLTCGRRTFTGRQDAEVVAGQPLSLSIHITLTEVSGTYQGTVDEFLTAVIEPGGRLTVIDEDGVVFTGTVSVSGTRFTYQISGGLEVCEGSGEVLDRGDTLVGNFTCTEPGEPVETGTFTLHRV